MEFQNMSTDHYPTMEEEAVEEEDLISEEEEEDLILEEEAVVEEDDLISEEEEYMILEEEAVVEEDDLILEGSEAVVAEDLILDIFLRLPPVSVVRFKPVSKSWYSLITNPSFLTNHACLLRSQRLLDPLVLVSNFSLLRSHPAVHPRLPSSNYRDSTKLYVIPTQDQDELEKRHPFLKVFLDDSLVAFRQKFSRCFLVDSCNGLLLYQATNRNLDTRYQYIVFNPITNQYKEVPIMGLLRDIKKLVLLDYPHIVFDPSISLSYKVLTVVPESRGRYQLYVYSSDTGSWRLLTRFIAKFGIGNKAFMFNGVFYWLVDNDDFSICFDVVNESVCFLSLPPRPRDKYREVFYFGECGGRLRLISEYYLAVFENEYYRDSSLRLPFSFDIMEKDLYSTVWTLKFRVNIEGGYEHLIQRRSDPYSIDVRVLTKKKQKIDVRVLHLYQTERGEEVVLLRLWTVDHKMIVSFNITTNTFGKEIPIRNFNEAESLNAFPFTPTLFPLSMTNADNFEKWEQDPLSGVKLL